MPNRYSALWPITGRKNWKHLPRFPPDPPDPDFGPTDGAQSVRDNAGPLTVTDPGGGIAFDNTDNLQALIDANPASSVFVGAGNQTYSIPSGINSGSTKAPTIIFLPGAVIDGGNATATGIDGITLQNATVKGGTFQGYRSGFLLQDNSILEDVVVTGCFNNGVGGPGDNTRCTRVRFADNGKYGLLRGTTATGNLVEYCEFDNNNTRLLSPYNDAGTMKLLHQSNMTMRNNWCHDNYGFGIWFDANEGGNVLIEENVCENNETGGIFYEISGGGTTIRRNYLLNNPVGYADFGSMNLMVSSSDAREGGDNDIILVTDNVIDGDGTQVLGAIVSHRVHELGGGHVSYGNHIVHNQFWLRGVSTKRLGGAASSDIATNIFSGRDNFFDENEYHLSDSALAKFQWSNTPGSALTWAQWQGAGQDPNGTLMVDL